MKNGHRKGMGPAGGLWRRANVHVATVGGGGWMFALWDLANVHSGSAADLVWMFVVWHCANVHPAPADDSLGCSPDHDRLRSANAPVPTPYRRCGTFAAWGDVNAPRPQAEISVGTFTAWEDANAPHTPSAGASGAFAEPTTHDPGHDDSRPATHGRRLTARTAARLHPFSMPPSAPRTTIRAPSADRARARPAPDLAATSRRPSSSNVGALEPARLQPRRSQAGRGYLRGFPA
jgi:hypothetical protein